MSGSLLNLFFSPVCDWKPTRRGLGRDYPTRIAEEETQKCRFLLSLAKNPALKYSEFSPSDKDGIKRIKAD